MPEETAAEQDFDFSGFRPETNDSAIKKLIDGARHQMELKSEVEKIELLLKNKKAEHLNHEQFVMPDLMKQADLTEFKNEEIEVKLSEKIRVNVSEDRKEEAYKWLKENGEGRLIKTCFTVDIDTLDFKAIEEFRILLGDLKYDFKQSHNANSLTSTIGKKMDNGDEVPQKTFGIYHQKFCKLSVPKVKKSKKKK